MERTDPKDRPTYAELVARTEELEHQLAMALAQIDDLRERVDAKEDLKW